MGRVTRRRGRSSRSWSLSLEEVLDEQGECSVSTVTRMLIFMIIYYASYADDAVVIDTAVVHTDFDAADDD